MKRSCGPERATLASCSAVRPLRPVGSTMNWQPNATRIARPGFGASGPQSRMVPFLTCRIVTDLERMHLRGLSASARACGDQAGDPRERAQILEVDVFDLDSETETLLELQQQLHQLERVENTGLEKIGVRGRRLDVETLDEQSAEAPDDRVRVGHSAPL